MKPVNKNDSTYQMKFACPHDIYLNTDEAKRISKKRNKRNRSKAVRKFYKNNATKQEGEIYGYAANND